MWERDRKGPRCFLWKVIRSLVCPVWSLSHFQLHKLENVVHEIHINIPTHTLTHTFLFQHTHRHYWDYHMFILSQPFNQSVSWWKSGRNPGLRFVWLLLQLVLILIAMGAVMAALSMEARRLLSRPTCLSHCGQSTARYHRSGRLALLALCLPVFCNT